MLERVESQYVRLKNNFDKNKDPFLSKFSIPLRDSLSRSKCIDRKGSALNLSSE